MSPTRIDLEGSYAYALERITWSGFGGGGEFDSIFPRFVRLTSGIGSSGGVVEAAKY